MTCTLFLSTSLSNYAKWAGNSATHHLPLTIHRRVCSLFFFFFKKSSQSLSRLGFNSTSVNSVNIESQFNAIQLIKMIWLQLMEFCFLLSHYQRGHSLKRNQVVLYNSLNLIHFSQFIWHQLQLLNLSWWIADNRNFYESLSSFQVFRNHYEIWFVLKVINIWCKFQSIKERINWIHNRVMNEKKRFMNVKVNNRL